MKLVRCDKCEATESSAWFPVPGARTLCMNCAYPTQALNMILLELTEDPALEMPDTPRARVIRRTVDALEGLLEDFASEDRPPGRSSPDPMA